MIKTCPCCGTTADEFRNTGFLGCQTCYLVFREEISAALKDFQGGSRHTGKRLGEAFETERRELVEKYNDAIERGDLRAAGRFRSELAELDKRSVIVRRSG